MDVSQNTIGQAGKDVKEGERERGWWKNQLKQQPETLLAPKWRLQQRGPAGKRGALVFREESCRFDGYDLW